MFFFLEQGVSQQHNTSRNSEAELDFDPFQVTQKGFAEIMATEQHIKQHNSGLSSGNCLWLLDYRNIYYTLGLIHT